MKKSPEKPMRKDSALDSNFSSPEKPMKKRKSDVGLEEDSVKKKPRSVQVSPEKVPQSTGRKRKKSSGDSPSLFTSPFKKRREDDDAIDGNEQKDVPLLNDSDKKKKIIIPDPERPWFTGKRSESVPKKEPDDKLLSRFLNMSDYKAGCQYGECVVPVGKGLSKN